MSHTRTDLDGPSTAPAMCTAEALAELREVSARILRAVETVIDGKPAVVRTVVTVLLAGGHLLVEDVPGVGKTMLAKAMARSVDCTVRRIQSMLSEFLSHLIRLELLLSGVDPRRVEYKIDWAPPSTLDLLEKAQALQAIGMAASFNTDLMYQVASAIGDEARAKYNGYKTFGDTLIYQGVTCWSPRPAGHPLEQV